MTDSLRITVAARAGGTAEHGSDPYREHQRPASGGAHRAPRVGAAPARLIVALALGMLFAATVASSGPMTGSPPLRPEKVSPGVWARTVDGQETSFFIVLKEQADLSRATERHSREARLDAVHELLSETALRSQAGVRSELDESAQFYRPYYVVNMVLVSGDRGLVERMAGRPDVAAIAANPRVRHALPPTQDVSAADDLETTIEWGVLNVNANDVWAMGFTGTNIVVAGQDTGYDWDHPALIRQYRGYNGVTATHDYHWHDAVHSGGGSCGADSPEPCDDGSHGTHTMGTIVGDDGAGNQVGVAPGARWIGCRNMDEGYGTPETYAECFEFFLAPYPVGGDPLEDGEPVMAPHVINNSWTCPESEGCYVQEREMLRQIVENVRAAGILVVASAGNHGSACSTVDEPVAIYDAAFSVGATDSSDRIAGFSSRGPVTKDGADLPKPDVTGPGVSVRSCLPGSGYGAKSGTSMAGPHVAGAAALLLSAAPDLSGDVDAVEWILARTSRPHTTTQACGSDQPGDVPNNVFGWGIVDALAAVNAATAKVAISKAADFAPGVPAQTLVYSLRITNTSEVSLTQVAVSDTIPLSTTFAWASNGYAAAGDVVSWTLSSLRPQETVSFSFVVTITHLGPGARVWNLSYGVRAGEIMSPVMGTPVRAVVPWRIGAPVVRRNRSP